MESASKESEDCGSGFDRISLLPDDVIDKILTSLPIVEAAKTAVLSKYWKRGWRNISELKFDSSFGEKFENAGRTNLMLAICQILVLHSGSIDGFTLSIRWLESCAEINPVIQFLSDKNVKHLNIHFISGDMHILPSYLFSCFRLRTLVLVKCVLNLPRNFGGFSELTTLDLFDVDVTNDFGMFISNFPLLQQLRLEKCSFMEFSSINITAPNLRTFFCSGCNLLVVFVSAPLLNQLTLDVCNLSGASPKCLLQLKDLTVDRVLFADIIEASSLAGLIRSSPNIERLTIFMQENDDTAEVLEPKEYYFSCNNLHTVELYYLNSSNAAMEFIKALLLKSPQLQELSVWCVEVSSLIGLIRCSPGLERLTIWVNDYTAGINHEEEYGFSSNRLQTVELYSFYGFTNAAMAFIKALLLKSPQLQEMSVSDLEVSSLIGFIRCSPGLKRLKIWDIFYVAGDLINHDEENDFPCNRLQTVELCNFYGTNVEMMFVKALLLKSPQLKEMTIRVLGEEKDLQILDRIWSCISGCSYQIIFKKY